MAEAIGPGKKRPDGAKIRKLRTQGGLKQEVLAKDAGLSERLLRDIERKNHPVHSTIITGIATALKVPPDQITLSTPDISPDPQYPQMLKLRSVRSACELSRLAEAAQRYEWELSVDPTAATKKGMQEVLRIIRRLVERFSVTDEFDCDETGVARLARLQECLDTLRAGGVGVLAGSYYTLKEDNVPTCDISDIGEPWRKILAIRFAPGEVNEKVISVYTGKKVLIDF